MEIRILGNGLEENLGAVELQLADDELRVINEQVGRFRCRVNVCRNRH